MANLKVLMMGGRRCGKTSALSVMFDQMINGATTEVFTVNDETVLETKEGERQDSLTGKRLELKSFIGKGNNNLFIADQNPTSNFWDYKLRVQIPGKKKKEMEIMFRDSAGEFFDAGGPHHAETIQFVNDCDVFVVVVDTPYLMAGSPAEAEAANVVDSLHTFLTHLDTQDGRKAKQVIFVPIKCEKWVKEGKIDEVVKAVEDTYAATIRDLVASNKTEISIIPIETAGDIVFEELKDPYILVNTAAPGSKPKKCARISDSLVLLNDGKHHKVKEGEIVNEDPQGVFKIGEILTDIVRPNAWFRLRHDPVAQYSPRNCEQLPLHILRFMFNKKKDEAPGGIIDFFIDVFGGITAKDMEGALRKLYDAGMIKDNSDGIKVIHRCFRQPL